MEPGSSTSMLAYTKLGKKQAKSLRLFFFFELRELSLKRRELVWVLSPFNSNHGPVRKEKLWGLRQRFSF